MPVLHNPRWETFAQALAAGDSQAKAYRKAFPSSLKWKDKTVWKRATELFNHNGAVMGRYTELKEEAAKGAVLTRREKRELLAKMARDEKLPVSDRQRALDLDNKMENVYTNNVKLDGNLNNPFSELSTEDLKKLIYDE